MKGIPSVRAIGRGKCKALAEQRYVHQHLRGPGRPLCAAAAQGRCSDGAAQAVAHGEGAKSDGGACLGGASGGGQGTAEHGGWRGACAGTLTLDAQEKQAARSVHLERSCSRSASAACCQTEPGFLGGMCAAEEGQQTERE